MLTSHYKIFFVFFLVMAIVIAGCDDKDDDKSDKDKTEVSTESPQTSVEIEFDQDKTSLGRGWSVPKTDSEGVSYQWMVSTKSTIDLTLAHGRSYTIEFRIVDAMTPDIFDSLTLSVNNQPITLTGDTSEPPTVFSSTIPQSAVEARAKTTVLQFEVNRVVSPESLGTGTDTHTFGVALDWLRIHPLEDDTSVDDETETSTDSPQTAVEIEFDQDKTSLGQGWSVPKTDSEGVSYQWMVNTKSTIDLALEQGHSYEIEFRVADAMAPDIFESLTLSVNNEPIPLAGDANEPPVIFSGTIPESVVVIRPRSTVLQFGVNRVVSPESLGTGTDTHTFGVALDWLHIRPLDE